MKVTCTLRIYYVCVNLCMCQYLLYTYTYTYYIHIYCTLHVFVYVPLCQCDWCGVCVSHSGTHCSMFVCQHIICSTCPTLLDCSPYPHRLTDDVIVLTPPMEQLRDNSSFGGKAFTEDGSAWSEH